MSEARIVSGCPLRDFQLPDKLAFGGHPGGQDHLSEARASDSAGVMFLSYHSAFNMEKVAAKAKALGIKMPETGSIFDDVCSAIAQVQAEHPWQRFVFKAWCFAVSVGLVSGVFSWVHSPSVGKSVAMAFAFEMYFLNVFHMRHHMGGKLFQHELLDNMFIPLYNFLEYVWGYRPPAWHVNHHTRHHIHTNTDKDPDIPGSYPGIRCSEDQVLQGYHRYQTFYIPLVLPMVVPMLPLHNLFVSGGGVAAFVVWLGTWWGMFYMHGWYGVGQYCLAYGLTSFLTTYKFLVSHYQPALGSEHSNPSGAEAIDVWVRQQIEESMSWGGYTSCLLFGGLNTQIEHHISPALVPTLHSFMRPHLERICKKYGIKYTYEPTMLHAVWQFHKHLWVMGQKPSAHAGKKGL